MTVKYLKHGKPDVERAEDDAKTRQIVEATLADIQARGDTHLPSRDRVLSDSMIDAQDQGVLPLQKEKKPPGRRRHSPVFPDLLCPLPTSNPNPPSGIFGFYPGRGSAYSP